MRREIALHPPAGIGAVERHMGHALGVADGIGKRDRTALGNAEQREAVEPRGVDDRLQIRDPRVERKVLHFPVGEAAAALVIADERVAPSQLVQPVAPDGALPVESRCVIQFAALTRGGPFPWVA
jgi:hypothetical protein